MIPKEHGRELPLTTEFRATAIALLSGFREARSVLDVYIHVLEYWEEQLAPVVANRPEKPPRRVDPNLVRKAEQVKTMMSVFGKLTASGH